MKDHWGSFRKLSHQFYISTRMLVDGDPAIARFFCILRYRLPDQEKPCYQLMYRTSGANVNQKGAWYPCNGLLASYSTGELYYSKLNDTKFGAEIKKKEDLFQALLALRLENMNTREEILNELVRFGTPQFMHASSLMGGGIWKNPRIVAILNSHFDMPFKVSGVEEKEMMDVSGAIPITNEKMLNEYTGYALSVNYYKEDQYQHPSSPWIDFRQWLHHPVQVGIDSPMKKRMDRFTTTSKTKAKAKPYDCFQDLYYEDPVTGNRYLMEVFLHMNMDTINCSEFIEIKKRAIKRLSTFLLKEQQKQVLLSNKKDQSK